MEPVRDEVGTRPVVEGGCSVQHDEEIVGQSKRDFGFAGNGFEWRLTFHGRPLE